MSSPDVSDARLAAPRRAVVTQLLEDYGFLSRRIAGRSA